MKIIMSKSELLQIMKRLMDVTPGKTTFPILKSALVTAKEGKISFCATDLDQAITVCSEGLIQKKGRGLLPVRILDKALKAVSGEEISLDFNEAPKAPMGNAELTVTLKCGKTSLEIPTRPVLDFPKVPKLTADHIFSIDTGELFRMIDKTTYATGTDLTRPALTGVCFEISSTRLALISTDGHRLALVEALAKDKGTGYHFGRSKRVKGKLSVIVPAKTLNTLKKFGAGPVDINVHFSQDRVEFHAGSMTMSCLRIEGPFPNYPKVIPVDPPRSFTVNRKALIESVKRISLFSDSLTHQIILTAGPVDLTLSAKTEEMGKASETLEAEVEHGIHAGYNAHYLLQALSTLQTDTVVVWAKNADSATLIEETSGDLKHRILIMPLRLEA